MATVEPAIRQSWAENPGEEVDLIIHFSGDAGEASAALARLGVQVKRRFVLTRSLSIHCQAQHALQLLSEPWVTRLQLDRPVKALGR
jgi:hypothetical protein